MTPRNPWDGADDEGLTVGDLKRILDEIPDDEPVWLSVQMYGTRLRDTEFVTWRGWARGFWLRSRKLPS